MANTRKIVQAVRELMHTVARTNQELNQTLRHDYICGAWVADFSKHNATIIKMNTGYMATVYKRGKLIEQLFIVARENSLEINEVAGSRPTYIYHDPDKQTVFIGRYGRFSRDHNILAEDCSMDELDFLFPQVVEDNYPPAFSCESHLDTAIDKAKNQNKK